MNRTVFRGVVAVGVASAALLGAATPALAGTDYTPAASEAAAAAPSDVVVVDRPDTSDLHNKWTFAPLGVPVLGLIDSVEDAPGKLLPGA